MDVLAEDLHVYLSQFKQLEPEVVDRFAPGIYMRELHIPAGTWIVGKTHKTEHFNQVLKGHCIVNIRGRESEHKAGDTFLSYAGDKKIIFALEDSIWATIHPTKETDVDKIELEVIDMSAERLIENKIQTLIR